MGNKWVTEKGFLSVKTGESEKSLEYLKRDSMSILKYIKTGWQLNFQVERFVLF